MARNKKASGGKEGRQTKYNEETVEKICDTLERCGIIRRACEASGICQETFFTWRRLYPEFLERTRQAVGIFEENKREKVFSSIREMEEDALEFFKSTLRGEHTIQVIEEKTTILPDGSSTTTSTIRTKQTLPTTVLLTHMANRLLGETIEDGTLKVEVVNSEPEEGFNESEEGDEDL